MLEDGYISYWCWLLQTGIQPVLQPAPDPPWTLPTLTGVSTCWCYWHGENSRSEERDFFGSFQKRKVGQKYKRTLSIKAVKPGEDINENDWLIFCCWHPFFKIYTQNLCTQSCRAGPATPSAKQWLCSKKNSNHKQFI